MDFYRPSSLQGTFDALGSVYRALRAWKFYPKGHPTRKASVRQAYRNMLPVLDGNDLSLVCGLSGFAFPDGEPLKDATRLSASLAHEFFIRRIQKIVFLGDLSEEDLLALLRIVTQNPDYLQRAGGVDKVMAEQGIRTIWVNDFDLSSILEKRQTIEAQGVVPPGLDELEPFDNEEPAVPETVEADTDERKPEEELRSLLERIAATREEDAYLTLLRQAIGCAGAIAARGNLMPLLPMVELLARHTGEPGRGGNLPEYARFGLEQLASGDELVPFLLDRVDAPDSISRKALHALLSASGLPAIRLMVEKMGTTDSLAARKAMATLLVQLGEPAVESILSMIGDERWYIVRNLAAILGDIGSAAAVPELQKCQHHSDVRVCKEAIRSLAKIGGRDAETAVIQVLRDGDPLLLPQAITSLGGMKSRKALPDLMQIVNREDMFLDTLSLKTDAIAAISMIGERSVVPRLTAIIQSRRLMSRSRWTQLKIAIAVCLGKLGDTRALPVLRKLAASSGELGRACSEAVDAIERTGGDFNEGI